MMVNWDQWNSGVFTKPSPNNTAQHIPLDTAAVDGGAPHISTKPSPPSTKLPASAMYVPGKRITVDGEKTKAAADALKDVGQDMGNTADVLSPLADGAGDFKGDCFTSLVGALREGVTSLNNMSQAVDSYSGEVHGAVDTFMATDAGIAKELR